MLLLALQTTASAADDSSIDTLTIVLVVIFIASMGALSLLLRRGNENGTVEPPPAVPPADPVLPRPISPIPQSDRSGAQTGTLTPVWLNGVTFPATGASLAAAAEIIETLLAARRAHDLERGLALYSPDLLVAFRSSLGVDGSDLATTLDRATFAGEPPRLRSVELVSTTGNRMTIRARYSDGAAETYGLVRRENRWLIDSIDQTP